MKHTELQVYANNDLGEIKGFADKNGDLWFLAGSVCRSLGLKDSGRQVKAIEERFEIAGIKGSHTMRPLLESPGGKQATLFVSEQAMYELIFQSRKQKAIKSFADARRFADKFLAKYSVPQKRTTLLVKGFLQGLEAGKRIRIIDTREGLNQDLIINDIVFTYDTGLTEVSVGGDSELIFDWQSEVAERLRDLKQQDTNADLLQEYRQVSSSIITELGQKYKVYKTSPSDSFILGHTTLGRLRANLNMESDCSDNGNFGTWQGTDIDGDQYVSVSFNDCVLMLNLEENPQ